MDAALSISAKFRDARERAGLSITEAAARAGVSEPCIFWDLETCDDELMMVYSAADLQRFPSIFGVAPRELLGIEQCEHPLTVNELASAIHEHCRTRGITLAEFSDAAGWDVGRSDDMPHAIMNDISLDGTQAVCRELSIQWHRFIGGLDARC